MLLMFASIPHVSAAVARMMDSTLDPELTHLLKLEPKPKRQSKFAMLDGDEWPGSLGQGS
jgi:hypothetical protein